MGRLDDIGSDGMQLIADICQIYKNYAFKTEVIHASALAETLSYGGDRNRGTKSYRSSEQSQQDRWPN